MSTMHTIPHSATIHIFKIGQPVRLKYEMGRTAKPTNIYHIMNTLPLLGEEPQYRIRNDKEPYERVTTQDNLENAAPSSVRDNLIEITFGNSREKISE